MHRQAILVPKAGPYSVLPTSSASGLVELSGPARTLRSIRDGGGPTSCGHGSVDKKTPRRLSFPVPRKEEVGVPFWTYLSNLASSGDPADGGA